MDGNRKTKKARWGLFGILSLVIVIIGTTGLALIFVHVVASIDDAHDRFNLYDLLRESPTKEEVVGAYQFDKSAVGASELLEKGYSAATGTIELKSDNTYIATSIPGCCVHGYDERVYPFTGGIYNFSGTWQVVKFKEIYSIELKLDLINETTGMKIKNPALARERQPSSTLNLVLIRGEPLDVGFNLFDGDFWPLRFTRITKQKIIEQNGASNGG